MPRVDQSGTVGPLRYHNPGQPNDFSVTELSPKPGVDSMGIDGPPRLCNHRSGSNHNPVHNYNHSVTELSSRPGVDQSGSDGPPMLNTYRSGTNHNPGHNND